MTVLHMPIMGTVFNPHGKWLPIWEGANIIMGHLFLKAVYLQPPGSIWRRIRDGH